MQMPTLAQEKLAKLSLGIENFTSNSSLSEVAIFGIQGAQAAEGIWNAPTILRSGVRWYVNRGALQTIGLDGAAAAANASSAAKSASQAASAIGSTGQIGEDWLAQNLGGQSQVYFDTTQGGRYVDQLANGVAYESKVGYASLTPRLQLQIEKDAELLNSGRVAGYEWHFFQSPVTGRLGPSQPLLNELQRNGINVILH